MLAFFLVCNMINYSFFLNLFLPHGVLSARGSYRAVLTARFLSSLGVLCL